MYTYSRDTLDNTREFKRNNNCSDVTTKKLKINNK